MVTFYQRRRVWILSLVVSAALGAAGCNIFDWIDNPSGDDQLLSAARACMDQGDFECALEYYGQVSTARLDERASEQAFAILLQEGIGMKELLTAFQSGDAGKVLTTMANQFVGNASQTKRAALYQAYKKVDEITDTTTRGLVRFVTAIAVASEILAEGAPGDGNSGAFADTDLANNPSTCIPTSCPAPGGAVIVQGAEVDLTTGTAASFEAAMTAATPTLGMLHGCFKAMDLAYSSEIKGSGFGSGAGGMFDVLDDLGATPGTYDQYVPYLLQQGIGK